MKIKNVSEKVKNFKYSSGDWKVVQPGGVANLPASVLTNEEGVEVVEEGVCVPKVVEKEVAPEEKKVEEKEVVSEVAPKEPEVVELPKLSKSALKALSKDEQVEMLKKYGVGDEEVAKLNRESKRVKAILKLQED